VAENSTEQLFVNDCQWTELKSQAIAIKVLSICLFYWIHLLNGEIRMLLTNLYSANTF